MCLAIAAYKNRIGSLFETSERFIIIHPSSFTPGQWHSIQVTDQPFNELIQLLKENRVNTLICGAIRRHTRAQIEAHNIKVIPWITGDIQNVIHAFQAGNLFSPVFLMPGCRQQGFQKRQRFRRGRFH